MLDKEDWALIEKELSGSYGSVELKIDGYDVALQIRAWKARQYRIGVFVNGYIKGEDQVCSTSGNPKEPTEIARRFYSCRKMYLRSKKDRDKIRKAKKSRNKWMRDFYRNFDPDAVLLHWTGYWNSFTALKRHLIKNNQSIELAPDETLKELAEKYRSAVGRLPAETKAVDAGGEVG